MRTISKNKNQLFIIAIFAMISIIGKAQVSFISNRQNITSSDAWDIHLVDLNGDTIPDAYFENKVWLNDGKGNFTKTNTTFGTWPYTSFADLNGDGYVDVVSNDSIFLNDGLFHFNFSKKLVSDIVMSSSVLADIDNDGDIDIISCSDVTDRILLNDGKGNFTNTGKSLGGWGQASYAFGDINGDGYTDVYVAIPHIPPMGGHTPNLIWFGDSKGNFTQKKHDIPGAHCRGVILADFDNDGNLDLFVSDESSWGRIFFNTDGKGNFVDSGQRLGRLTNAVKAADFNNDGYIDLFICQGDGNGVTGTGAPSTVWLGNGHGNFTDSNLKLHLGHGNSIAADVADISGDGKTDVVVANVKVDTLTTPPSNVSAPIEIWLNNSTPTAIKQINDDDDAVTIYPNPTAGQVYISFGNTKVKKAFAAIFNPHGALVFSETFHNTSTATIDLKNFPKETYLVKVVADGNRYIDKIIKE